MNFRRILVVLFLILMMGLSFMADRGLLSAASPFAKENLDIENDGDMSVEQSTLSQEGDCIQIDPQKLQLADGDTIRYEFWDYKIVASNKDPISRCLILKDVPYSGFYDFYVEAGYTPEDKHDSNKEEYRLVIELSDIKVVGPIIPDPGDSTRGDIKDGRRWIRNHHKFQYLKKGDNKIYFEKGDQRHFLNSVYFRSITLIQQKPTMVAEPPFTAGTSNTVTYRTVFEDVYAQDVVFFDQTAATASGSTGAQLRKALPDSFRSVTFNGLLDGHTYGYYVETYITPSQTIYSDTTYSTQDATPPGKVVIDPMSSYANQRAELYWQGVCDSVSGVKFYEIVRYESTDGAATVVVGQMSALASCDTASFYHFTDYISDGSNLDNVYQYRIDAVDKVGNRSSGVPTQLVVGIPAPNICVIGKPVFEHYYQGTKVTVSADMSARADSIIFQIARDDAKFLDDRWRPRTYFFDSDTIPINKSTATDYTFDLTDSNRLSNSFVDGHQYYIRAQFKDILDNYSEWSDTIWIVPDCFPPEDIPSLTVVPVVNKANTKGWMDLNWGEAKDPISGLKNYLVFRKINGVDETFKLVGESLQTSYVDSFQIIDYNRDVTYQVRSVDRVANRRDESKHQVTAKCQAAPKQEISYELLSGGEKYTSRSIELHSVDLSHFKFDNTVAKIIVNWNGQEFEWREPLVAGVNTSGINLRDKEKYIISSKVIFTNKSQSLWSIPDTINKVDDISNLPLAGNKKTDDLCLQNYPNPFNPTTQISFKLEQDAHVVVEVYNVQGKKLKTLVDEDEKPGTVSANWNGTNDEEQPVASGLYFYHVHIAPDDGQEINRVQSMLLLK